MQYIILEEKEDLHPKVGEFASVLCRGTHEDGTELDTSCGRGDTPLNATPIFDVELLDVQ